MERIISYDEIPASKGESIYLRQETDPALYLKLLLKGYNVIGNITGAKEATIYVTGRRQDYEYRTSTEYRSIIDMNIRHFLKTKDIVKPETHKFSYEDLKEHKYQLPFVLKNENQNGGREKFLISTEEDYENLISACTFLKNRNLLLLTRLGEDISKYRIDYDKYLDLNFTIQEYIKTPSEFNTTVRIITTPSNDLLYAALKYNKPVPYVDDTTLLGYLLSKIYPLNSQSIVSNTLSGGKNILIGENKYPHIEKLLLNSHNIESEQFDKLLEATKKVHEQYKSELGIICGFDYIFDQEKQKWFLLEYHSRPMVGDYSKRQGIPYKTKEDRIKAEGRVRATALALTLKKTRKF